MTSDPTRELAAYLANSPDMELQRNNGSTLASDYPENWDEIATAVKEEAGWRCVRCGHPHELPAERILCDEQCDARRHKGGLNDGKQRVLTVHHLDGQKDNCAWWNLTALCQVCHLVIQAKVDMWRPWAFLEHSDWFKPYVAGWYAWRYLGQDLERDEVEERMDELLALEREAHGMM
jgi:hypothetical protein